MKTTLQWAAALGLSVCFTTSCSVSRMSYDAGSKPDTGKAAHPCFIELKNGSVRQFSTLKLVTGPFTSPYLLADGKERLHPAAIKAYQTDKLYAITQEIFVDNIRSKSAVETLPGFASRIVEGSLTIYCKKYYNGRGTAEQLFVQKNGGEIFAFTPELMENLLKDNMEAHNLFKKLVKTHPTSKRVMPAAEIFNRNLMLSKN